MQMQWTAWVTLAAVAVYAWMMVNVGKARGKYNVSAPSMDGPIEFQSVVRVHANTVEQTVMFLPVLWMCAYSLGDHWAALGGAIWVVGRIVYALGYYKAPDKRSAGFGITILSTLALMIGTGVGLLLH